MNREEFRPQAKFNGAWAKNERLDAIHKQLHISRTTKNYSDYEGWLQSYYAELYERIDPAEELELDKLLDRIKQSKTEYLKKSNAKRFNQRIRIPNIYPEQLYKLELRLFKIEKAAGFSNPDKEIDGQGDGW